MNQPTKRNPWKVFRSRLLDRIEVHMTTEGWYVITSNGKPLFAGDREDILDLVDTLQKVLAVTR